MAERAPQRHDDDAVKRALLPPVVVRTIGESCAKGERRNCARNRGWGGARGREPMMRLPRRCGTFFKSLWLQRLSVSNLQNDTPKRGSGVDGKRTKKETRTLNEEKNHGQHTRIERAVPLLGGARASREPTTRGAQYFKRGAVAWGVAP